MFNNISYPLLEVITSPKELANLVLWLDGSDGSQVFTDTAGTIPATNGSPVGNLKDKSGLAYHATSSGSSRPTFLTNAKNGLSGVVFSGSHLLKNIAFNYSRINASLFFVCNYTNVSTPNNIFSAADSESWAYYYNSTQFLNYFVLPNLLITSNTAVAANQYVSYSIINDSLQSPQARMYLGSSLVGFSNIGATGFKAFNLGAYNNGGTDGFFLNGTICEVIFYSRTLSNEERLLVSNYLSNKWAI